MLGLSQQDSSWFLPRTGRAYILLQALDNLATSPPAFTTARSYAQTRLLAPLRAGCTYRVTFYVRLAQGREFTFAVTPPIAIPRLSAHFSVMGIVAPNNDRLIAQPQVSSPPGIFLTDTANFTPVTGTFVAQGGEEYLTLGNFDANADTPQRPLWTNNRWGGASRYAIDDVSVVAEPPAGLALELGPDQLLGNCPNAAAVVLEAQPGFGSYRWNTGETTRRISVTRPGRYRVTANFGCGTLQDSLEVRPYVPIASGLLGLSAPPDPRCPNEPFAVTARPGFASYQWADGPTGPIRTLIAPGRYRLVARTADGCAIADSVLLTLALPPAVPRLPADTLVCADALPLRLPLPVLPPGLRYSWSGPLPSGAGLPVPSAGRYTLTVSNRCLNATTTVQVRTYRCETLDSIPNIITPNGDGLNEHFHLTAPSIRPLGLYLFDRWGREVYRTDDYRNDWPNVVPAPGLYFYLVVDGRYKQHYKGWLEVRP